MLQKKTIWKWYVAPPRRHFSHGAQPLEQVNFEQLLLRVLHIRSHERLLNLKKAIVFNGIYTSNYQENQEFLARDVRMVELQEDASVQLVVRMIALEPSEYLSISVDSKSGAFLLKQSSNQQPSTSSSRASTLHETERLLNQGDLADVKLSFIRLRYMVRRA